MERRRTLDERKRLILIYLLAALVLSFFGTFTAVLLVQPGWFLGVIIVIGLPIAVTTSMVTHLNQSIDRTEGD